MIGTKGISGVLNGRSRSGRVLRRIQTPAQTSTNASSVPMLTSCPSSCSGRTPVARPTATPVKIVDRYGVRNFGCTAAPHLPIRPSRDIE